MDHPHEPTWIPYAPPPSSTLRALLRRYGFAVALVLFAGLLLGGLVLGSSEYTARPPSGARNAGASPLSARPETYQPYAGEATLSVATEPAGAVVRVDRRVVGRAPLNGQVIPAGVHLLTVLKEGYVPMDSVIVLRTDAHPRVTVILQPLPGYTPEKDDPPSRSVRPRVPRKAAPQAPHLQQGWLASDSTRRAHLRRSVERALNRRPAPADTPLGW